MQYAKKIPKFLLQFLAKHQRKKTSSRFDIHVSALNWFRSCLSSRYFRVKCVNNFSHILDRSVPNGTNESVGTGIRKYLPSHRIDY